MHFNLKGYACITEGKILLQLYNNTIIEQRKCTRLTFNIYVIININTITLHTRTHTYTHTHTYEHTHIHTGLTRVPLNGTVQVHSNVFQENVADTIGAAVALVVRAVQQHFLIAVQRITVFQNK